MSTATQVTSTPAPSSTDSSPYNAGSFSSTNRLYLYTFLTTLLLLVSVSVFVIGRSVYLRRQFRLGFEEALRRGQVIAPFNADFPGVSRKILEPPPEMWETYISPGESNWKDMPLSIALVPRKLQLQQNTEFKERKHKRVHRALRHFIKQEPEPQRHSTLPSEQLSFSLSNNDATKAQAPPKIRVTTLIAMPNPRRPVLRAASSVSTTASSATAVSTASSASTMWYDKGKWKDDAGFRWEEGIPPLMVGVADVELQGFDMDNDTKERAGSPTNCEGR